MIRILIAVKLFLKDRFNLSNEQDDNLATIASIEKGVVFKGISVWTLIFAIFVASIGLNVNSTAVIIGAMLISPLMGPIMGLGLSVGIYDFTLLKKSLKNLSIAVVISVLTSATYFIISPLDEAQSELLARTTPTIYDVLIAFFGGMAGIVAGASKEKGNAIPGVAIATALMPPLCTAGFGIATGNIYYFLGAFYLFFINAVMISLSTFLMVRFLKFPPKQIVDKSRSFTVRKYIYLIVFITVLPSIYFAYKIIKETVFNTNANTFINKELIFDKTQILSKALKYSQSDSSEIIILLAGESIDNITIDKLKIKMHEYAIDKTKLIIKQGIENATTLDIGQLKTGIIEEIYHKNELALASKDQKIKILEKELLTLKSIYYPIKEITEEINAINPKIQSLSASPIIYYSINKSKMDTTLTVNLKTSSRLYNSEYKTIRNWLYKRLKNDSLKIIFE